MRKKLKELSNIEHYSHRINWAKQKYKYISSGSSRKVFHYSDTLVIKIAYNGKGIAQNMAECDIWRFAQPNQRKVLAAIVDSCPHNTWVLQKKIHKKLSEGSDVAYNFYTHKKAKVFDSLRQLDFNNEDTMRSLGYSKKGIVLYDYGFTNYVNKHFYQ